MRRRAILAGLGGLAGTSLLTASTDQRTFAGGDPVGTLQAALLAPSLTNGAPVELPRLRQQIAAARRTFQLGHYTELAARLPALLAVATATQAAQAGGERLAVADVRIAEMYTLATELLIKLGRDQLAWTTADRAQQAAHSSGDLLTQASTRRTWGIVLRRAGSADIAQRLIVDTAAALQPELHRGSAYLAGYGSLLATAGYTAAVDGQRDTALALLAEAEDAARRVGVGRDAATFGPTAIALYRVSAARVLGDCGTAIDHARRINPLAIPTAESCARYWTNVARAFAQWGKPEPCYRALLAAERAAPDEVRYRKPVQQVTADLLAHPTVARTLPGLRGFARRAGLPA